MIRSTAEAVVGALVLIGFWLALLAAYAIGTGRL